MNRTGFFALVEREMRRFFSIPAQTILPPIISTVLYVVIFGSILGERIGEIFGFPYMVFFIPGLIMMTVVSNAYINGAFTIFQMKFMNYINDLLITPLSYFEIAAAMTLASMARGIVTGMLIYLIFIVFIPTPILHPLAFIFFMVFTSAIFSIIGLLIGIWGTRFDHLNIFVTFFITPLTFLGGVFHAVSMLPQEWQWVTVWNPFFYMINGLRYSVIGFAEGDVLVSGIVIFASALALFGLLLDVLKKGYRIKS